MITYRKGCCGFHVLLHYAGTAWPSGVIPALMSAGIGLALSQVREINLVISDQARFIDNPYPFQLFAYLVGFIMVFRTNFAYQRYWEALDAVQRMGAKWFDGACMAVAFDAPGDVDSPFLAGNLAGRQSAEKEDPKATGRPHCEFFQDITHLFSLLHALALQHLRADPDLSNLHYLKRAPANEVQMVAAKSPRCSKLSAHSIQDYTYQLVHDNAMTAFSDVKVRNQHQLQKLRILGSCMPEELVLLDTCASHSHTPTLARVAMVQGWIMRRLIARQKYESRGDMGRTSPPILSRLYQVIADGHMGFSQASKVVTVPFPFPYHNMIRIFLWMFALTVPFVINSKVFSEVARFSLNFVVVWAYFSLAEVGDNLEDPFLPYDINELPLQSIQHSFNARLLALNVIPARPPRTPAASDVGDADASPMSALSKENLAPAQAG